MRHDRGRIIEENHYYAYGLKIAALSSKAFGGAPNNYQYQGDYSEFDDDLGWNDFALRSYDPQIGRFLQHDPYDEFASGYIGMGNDPANLTDPNGGCTNCFTGVSATLQGMFGTLTPVTVFGQAKVLTTITSTGASVDAVKRVIDGGKMIDQAVKNGQLINRLIQLIRFVAPLAVRPSLVAVGVLIPIKTGPGASFTPEQMYEKLYGNPEDYSDEYLAEAEKRLNSGNPLPNDWRLAEEIQRRKTARQNGGGDSGSGLNEGSPQKYRNGHLANEKHPKTGVQFDEEGFPDISEHLYKNGKNDVSIKPTGNRKLDFDEANKAAGYRETPKGYTWHHHQTRGRMQLVETNVHSQTGHTGGFSLW